MPARPVVRIVVVTYSPGRTLDAFLDSVPQACSSHPYEVVCADNGSTDGAPERAAASGRARLIRTGGNLGFGGAANVGAAGATTEFLLVANPDLVFAAGAIDELIAAAGRHPEAAAFGPAIYTDGELYPSARRLPDLGNGIGHALVGKVYPANRWTRAYRAESDEVTERRAGWLSGACVLIRRAAFEQVGGFDRRYFMYCEDMDLGRRLGRAGLASIYVPAARVEHTGGASTQKVAARMLAEHHKSMYRYLAQDYPGPARAPLRLALGAGLAARYAAARLGARPRS